MHVKANDTLSWYPKDVEYEKEMLLLSSFRYTHPHATGERPPSDVMVAVFTALTDIMVEHYDKGAGR